MSFSTTELLESTGNAADASMSRAQRIYDAAEEPGNWHEKSVTEEFNELDDTAQEPIRQSFIDEKFNRDLLGDVLGARTDAQCVAVIRRLQGLWQTHLAVELGR